VRGDGRSGSAGGARRAGVVGRLLRLAVGLALLASIARFYLDGTPSFVLGAALSAVLLLGAYAALHRLVASGRWRPRRRAGALAVALPFLALYLLGIGGGPLFGRGEGQLGALTFLGLSLVGAALAGDAGCELLVFPNLVARRTAELACLVFSPVDALERRWFGSRSAR
jgi:hypothetical protein